MRYDKNGYRVTIIVEPNTLDDQRRLERAFVFDAEEVRDISVDVQDMIDSLEKSNEPL